MGELQTEIHRPQILREENFFNFFIYLFLIQVLIHYLKTFKPESFFRLVDSKRFKLGLVINSFWVAEVDKRRCN